VRQLAVRHDHRRGVHAGMPGHAFQVHGRVQQIAHLLVALVLRRQVPAVEFVPRRQHILDRDGLAGDARDKLGDLVHLIQRNFLGAAHVSDGGARLHPPKGSDLRHLVLAVLLQRVADHLLTLVVGEVQVKVGHGHAARVEEALKDQVVLKWVQPRNANTVRHNRACAGAAYVPPDVPLPRKVAQVRHDQEVHIKAHLVDDAQLALLALLNGFAVGLLAVQPLQSLLGEVAQIALVGEALGDRQVREVIVLVLQVYVAHLCNAQRVVECARRQVNVRPERSLHLLAALQKIAAVGHAHAVLRADRRAGLYAQQHIMRPAVRFAHIVHVVRDNHLQAELVRPRNQHLVDRNQLRDAVLLQLDKEVLAAEHVHVPAQPLVCFFLLALIEQLGNLSAETACGGNHALRMGGEKIVINTRAVVVAVEMGVRADLQQIPIAGEIARQQQEVIVLPVELDVAPAHRPAPHRLVPLQPDDGVNLRGLTGPKELDRSVHRPMVGQGQSRLPQPLGLRHQVLDPAQSVEQGIFGVRV